MHALGYSWAPMPIRAISFDLFDTLVDLLTETIPRVEYCGHTVPGMLSQLHVLVARKNPVDFDEFLRVMKEVDGEFRQSHYAHHRELATRERFEALLGRLGSADGELVTAMVDTHMGGLYEQVEFVEHHRAVLSELKDNFRLAVCSNFSHSETAHRVLRSAGLDDLMDAILISDAVGIRKPAAKIFRDTLEALDVEPGELLHVGDSLGADVAGAAALGIRTAWVVRRVQDPEAALREQPDLSPDYQIADLAEIPSLIRSLGSGS
jgi:2-haloalkanoic acid dehalogenase type II